MALENVVATIPGVVAGADLSSSQFHFMELTSTEGEVDLVGNGAKIDGVLQNVPTLGQAATVWTSGSTTKVEAGASVTAGALVASDATGRAVAATTGEFAAGTAREAASGAGELITVTLTFPGRVA